jgi:hypothetical protein
LIVRAVRSPDDKASQCKSDSKTTDYIAVRHYPALRSGPDYSCRNANDDRHDVLCEKPEEIPFVTGCCKRSAEVLQRPAEKRDEEDNHDDQDTYELQEIWHR